MTVKMPPVVCILYVCESHSNYPENLSYSNVHHLGPMFSTIMFCADVPNAALFPSLFL